MEEVSYNDLCSTFPAQSCSFSDTFYFDQDPSISMASLKYYNYPGVGEQNKENHWYSQAVRIGDRIECSGQGMSTE